MAIVTHVKGEALKKKNLRQEVIKAVKENRSWSLVSWLESYAHIPDSRKA